MDKLYQTINEISPISQEIYSELAPHIKKIKLSKSDFFVKEGEISKEIGFLEKGIIRAFYINKDGKEYNKNLFVAPSFVGSYSSIITGNANRLPQQALTDCDIWKISVSNLEHLSAKHCEFERLRRKIAENFFVMKEKRELEMALLDAQERYLLLQKEFPDIEMQISQYHIASYLGISSTQLSRIRNKITQTKEK